MVKVIIETKFLKFHGKVKRQISESTIGTKFGFIYMFQVETCCIESHSNRSVYGLDVSMTNFLNEPTRR